MNTNNISIVQTIASIAQQYGGPSRSVPGLSDALCQAGAKVSIVTIFSPLEAQLRPQLKGVGVINAEREFGFGAIFARRFRDELTKTIRDTCAALVHDHGIWMPSNHAAASVCRKLAIPRVVSTRGMLEPWAMGYKRLKKRLAWHLYQRKDLELARAFHATSAMEAESIRQLGFRQSIAVIPNGVSVPSSLKGTAGLKPKKRRQAVFLSRINPKKGLPNLVAAWEIVRPPDWRLLIVGPDEGGYRGEIELLIRQKGLTDCLELRGEVDDEEKWKIYQESQLFVLPSHTENFGIAIAEALSAGVPVITTRATPWDELESKKCGWWIEIGIQPLADALRKATAMDAYTLQAMGQRGAELIASKYEWTAIGQEMLRFYKWLTVGGPNPFCLFD
jgi:glycosyltransferase involved in cell wall biosynthesis